MAGGDGIILRPIAAADLDAVAALHAAAFAALATSHHDARQVAAAVAEMRAAAYRRELTVNNLLLAVDGAARILASAGWCRVPDRPEQARIRKVYIVPDLAGHGLGRRVVEAAEAAARGAGFAGFTVRASANAEGFYARLGYRPVTRGTQATPAGVDLPVVFMDKD